MSTKRTARQRSRGFTLIELIIFIVVISVGLMGILSVLNIAAKSSSDPLFSKQALAIAESLMEEIQSKDFAPPATNDFVPAAPPAVGERQFFDNVADFDYYGAASLAPVVLRAGIFDVAGNPIAALPNYRVLVRVPASTAAVGGVAAPSVLVITVQVTDPVGNTYTLTGYRINYD